MQVKLRLQRFGNKKRPYYRIVASNSGQKRDGKFLEILGIYHPVSKGEQVRLEEEKIRKWLNLGAQPSETVKSLLSQQGIWADFAQAQEARRRKRAMSRKKSGKQETQPQSADAPATG